MAVRQIPNLTPVVFLSPTAQLEIVQDGTTYRANAQQIANLSAGGALTLVNDVTSTTTFYPIYADVSSGTITKVYASDPDYEYIPAEGRLTSKRLEASQGLVYNNSVVSLDYTFPTGDNATSCGPLLLTAAITVPAGSEWMVL